MSKKNNTELRNNNYTVRLKRLLLRSPLKAILVIFLAVITSYLIFSSRNNIFTIIANSEIVHIVVQDELLAHWDIGGAKYTENFFELDKYETLGEFSTLAIKKDTEVKITHSAKQKISISLKSKNKVSAVIKVQNKETGDVTVNPLGQWVNIILSKSNGPYVFPYRGEVVIGNDVTTGVNNVLINGKVRIIEEMLVIDGRYTAGEYELDSGDKVQLLLNDKTAMLNGFVRIENEKPLSIVGYGDADVAEVIRLGSATYKIKSSDWARVTRDPVTSILMTMFGLIYLILDLSNLIVDHIRNYINRTV